MMVMKCKWINLIYGEQKKLHAKPVIVNRSGLRLVMMAICFISGRLFIGGARDGTLPRLPPVRIWCVWLHFQPETVHAPGEVPGRARGLGQRRGGE